MKASEAKSRLNGIANRSAFKYPSPCRTGRDHLLPRHDSTPSPTSLLPSRACHHDSPTSLLQDASRHVRHPKALRFTALPCARSRCAPLRDASFFSSALLRLALANPQTSIMQSPHSKRSLDACREELDAKLELLSQLCLQDVDDSQAPDSPSNHRDRSSYRDAITDQWIQAEYRWALEAADDSAVSLPDLFDGGERSLHWVHF